ncbi:MAG: hypothetical protein L3J39_13130 [Verrucomicrobiales bacterium]|nr:hypothetical protein [Verrucomicrobiales bacterium]
MKTPTKKLLTITTIIASVISFSAFAPALQADEKDKPDHSHEKKIAGPNGGLLITSVTPHLEFFVTKERKVQITAVDDHNKVVPIADQSVKVTGGSRSKPTRMEFEKKGGVLLSNNTFPEGKKLPVVLQIKVTPDSKTITKKFYLDQGKCPECELEEYACICEHTH